MITLEIPVGEQSAEQREKLFIDLYEKAFPFVAEFVVKHRGTFSDAKDIFQDALVIFYEKMTDGKVNVTVSEEAYLLGIAKHVWLKKFKRDKPKISLHAMESVMTIPDDYFPEIQTRKVLYFLEQTGQKCMALLTAFYYRKESMMEIKKMLGYSTERSATVQKYKCLEKIRDKVKEKSMNYEDFTE